MVYVGNPGDRGIVEMQDLLFTSLGVCPASFSCSGTSKASLLPAPPCGVSWDISILGLDVEIVADAIWGVKDCHFRIGGAKGSQLQVSQCPKLSGGIIPHCIAATGMLAVHPQAGPYFENMWLWVAGMHDLRFTAREVCILLT